VIRIFTAFALMADIQRGKLALFLIGSTLLIVFTFYTYQIVYTPNILVDKDDREFLVKQGDSFRAVQLSLGDQGFVNDMVSFSFLARMMKYDRKVRPGLYLLKRNMTNLQAIEALRAGDQVPVNVTFNNVRLISELGPKITKNIALSPEEFQVATDSFANNNQDGFTHENIIGMFIPNTYQVYYDISAEDLVARMYSEYSNFWTAERREKAKLIGMTPTEVSTLASIVQAEAWKSSEAPTIAGLYLNRLKKGIPLQADPTLVFAVGDFSLKRILNVHKEIDSPYNTYLHAGLPPGPINMPTIASLDAVLNAEKHKYLYMCAREDFSGYHNFARTLTEHNRNAARYQQALTIEQRKARTAAKKK
jgi:UPF0755 protein